MLDGENYRIRESIADRRDRLDLRLPEPERGRNAMLREGYTRQSLGAMDSDPRDLARAAYRVEREHGFEFAKRSYEGAIRSADRIDQRRLSQERGKSLQEAYQLDRHICRTSCNAQGLEQRRLALLNREDRLYRDYMAPASTRVNFALAHIRTGEPGNIKEGCRLIERALALRPEMNSDERFHRCVARAYEEGNRRRTVPLQPENPGTGGRYDFYGDERRQSRPMPQPGSRIERQSNEMPPDRRREPPPARVEPKRDIPPPPPPRLDPPVRPETREPRKEAQRTQPVSPEQAQKDKAFWDWSLWRASKRGQEVEPLYPALALPNPPKAADDKEKTDKAKTPPGKDGKKDSRPDPSAGDKSDYWWLLLPAAGGAAWWLLKNKDRVGPIANSATVDVKPEYKDPKIEVKDKSGRPLEWDKFDPKTGEFTAEDGSKVKMADADYKLQIPEGLSEADRKAAEAKLRTELASKLAGPPPTAEAGPLPAPVPPKEVEKDPPKKEGETEPGKDPPPKKEGETEPGKDPPPKKEGEGETARPDPKPEKSGELAKAATELGTTAEVLERVTGDLAKGFTAQDLQSKVDDLIARDEARAASETPTAEEAKATEALRELKTKLGDPMKLQRAHEALTKLHAEQLSKITGGTGTSVVSTDPLKPITGEGGTIRDGVAQTETIGDVPPLPADYRKAIEEETEKVKKQLAELDEKLKENPKDEQLRKERVIAEAKLNGLHDVVHKPTFRARALEWIKGPGATAAKGAGAAALVVFVYAIAVPNASASDKIDHATLRKK